MTAPCVHRRRCSRTAQFRFCGRCIAAIASFISGLLCVMPVCAQRGTVPPSNEPPPAASQQAVAKPAALPATPVFEVASIHPNNSDHTARTHIYSYADHGHFVAINATPMQLLQFAYVLPDSRILGAPAWTKSSKYDIEGKSDPALADRLATLPYTEAKVQLLKMVQSLFVDRFHLGAHTESRELPVYNLVVIKGGVKFSTVKDEGTTIDSGTHSGTSTITIKSSSDATASLAEILYRYTGRVVIDKTGLTGNYSLALHFTPDDSVYGGPASGTSAASDPGPSVFTALKEQLGLELKSGKAQVDVLVIDHIDPPTEN